MFGGDVTFRRLWRRIAQRYPFAQKAKFNDALERLYKQAPEKTYAALQALGEERQRLDPDEINAYFVQLLTLQAQAPTQEIDPKSLLETLVQLGVARAWRWFNFGLHQQDSSERRAYFARENETSQATFDGLNQGVSAYEVERVLRYYAEALTGPGWPVKFVPQESLRPHSPDALSLPDHLWAYPLTQTATGQDGEDLYFRLYKWLITHELGHRHGGTYRVAGAEDQEAGRALLAEFTQSFSDPYLAEGLFHLFEDVRIEAYLLRQYPGFQAERNALLASEFPFRPTPFGDRDRFLEALLQRLHWKRTRLSLSELSQTALEQVLEAAQMLDQPASTVDDALRLTRVAYYQVDELFDQPRLLEPLSLSLFPHESTLYLDPPKTPSQQRCPRAWHEEPSEDGDHDPAEVEDDLDDNLGARAFRYDEWDCRAGRYRPNWCTVYERLPAEAETISTLFDPRVSQVRRAFEWMAEEDWKRQRRQLEGDEIDLEAWVEGVVDRRVGLPLPEKIYTQRLRKNRDLCAAIVVDQSDSTARLTPSGQPVINVEREALRYLCEALEALHDEYALFSYSGDGRGHVDCFTLKAFDERYGLTVQRRLEALRPLAQNRDGCVLRHITQQMNARSARTKLLLHISDGRPWDHGYAQRYALEDTKKAVQEARAQGIKVFGVICDPYAPTRVKDTYGKGRVLVVQKVEELSELLLGLYRKITW